MNGYWFTSALFQVEAGEDAETNPGRYGRQLAIWLKRQLEERGYSVEPVIPEDWGRCLMCSRETFRLWVGCANVADPEMFGLGRPQTSVVWHCFVAAEVPFWRRLFSRPDHGTAVAELDADLGAILAVTTGINLIEEP